MLSSLRLPLRSPKASVRSSTTRTLPGGSPRGDTSQLPSAALVASRKKGLAAMKRADSASTLSMAFSATAYSLTTSPQLGLGPQLSDHALRLA